LVERFLAGADAVHSGVPATACFGLPGPVVHGECETPNLPWRVVAAELARRFSIPEVLLLNDLEATAHSVSALESSELVRLSDAEQGELGRPRGLIAAGTGLGMAILVPDGSGFRPLASEGGHVEFAPQNALEAELLRFLQRELEHVSIERVVSGPGLVRVYEFFCERGSPAPNPQVALRIAASPSEAPALITQSAGECAACAAALDLFIAVYGAVAGNLALTAYATGGLYVAGGIAPKILPVLQRGGFLRAFNAKGRLASLTRRVPVHVVLNEQAPLFGAAAHAARRLSR
jgi:glucokinase